MNCNLSSVLIVLAMTGACFAQDPSSSDAKAPAAAAAAAAPEATAAAASTSTTASPENESRASLDEAAIRHNAQAYVEAFNSRDANALAALWSVDAIYSDPDSGAEIVGRPAISEYFTGLLADVGDDKLEVEIRSVDFVSPNVAIEQGAARVVRPNSPPEQSTYSAVHVKQGGRWLLDRVAEVEQPPQPKSNYEHLKELEWMVGSWVDADETATVQTDCEWTKNKNFLSRSFAVVARDGVAMAGTQIIGWDPAAKRIRSWVFDSNGGFGEGSWTNKDGEWIIQSTSTLADGGKGSAVNIMKPIDQDSFTWQAVNRQVDGQVMPNVPAVLVVRATGE